MNYRGMLKSIFVFITFIISFIFIIIQYQYPAFFYPASPIYFLTIGLLVFFYEMNRRKKFTGWKKKLFIFVIIFNVGLIVYYVIQLLIQYVIFHSLESNITFYYSLLLWILLICSLFDCREETSFLNDILTIVTCVVITLVFYRYEVDPNFRRVLSSSHYVIQYYSSFVFVILTLLIQRGIVRMKKI